MIKKLILPVWIMFLGMLMVSAGFAQNPYFISDPTFSPDGEIIVFVYENDLWRVHSSGGTAYRLTSLDGQVSVPRFSPNGQWLAFTSTRDNNANVYVLPAQGGEIKQLTWHESADVVDSWSWDSQFIYFHSSRENMSSVFKVSLDAETPQRLFDNYFNLEHHLVEHPQTGAFIFTESWESLRFPQRKRYRGEHNPDILSYNAANDQFFSITSYKGKDMWPTIDKNGNIYYVSDEFNGEYNLYVYNGEEIQQLTVFDHSVGRPQVSADGSMVVFVKGYQLHVYDVATAQTKRIEMNLFQSPITDLEQSFQVKGEISSFDISPDTKKMAFISRGELFVSDIEGKFVRKLSINPLERVLEVKWLADNKTLLYTRTHKGWANLFTISADGSGTEKQLEDRPQTTRNLSFNADRTSAVYLSGRNELRLLNLSDFTSRLLVADEMWGLYNPVPYFSPDDKHIVFTAIRAFEQDVMIHHLESGETTNLTLSGVSQRQPSWSPDGKYVYFISDRVTPSYPRSNTQNTIYRIPLYRFRKPLREEGFDKLFSVDEEKDTLSPVVRFDLTDVQNRWEEIRVNGGVQWAPQVYEHKDGQYLFFVSNHEAGKMALYKREFTPFEDDETEKIDGPNPGSDPQIVKIKDKFWILAAGNIHELKPDANKMEAIDIQETFSRNLSNEFTQVFYETWTTLEENFYDEDFHGIDWKETLDYYAAFLPQLRNRENLRTLLNDMLGELNSSHMGFSSTGDEEEPFFERETAETGIIFSLEDPFVVERIITGSHLDITDKPVVPGDRLLAVNGCEIDETTNRDVNFYFTERPDELALAFQRGETRFVVNLRSHSPSQISTLLYNEWINENRKYVEQKSDNRIAYVYMRDMSAESLEQFLIDMTTFAQSKDALLFDIRFNRGGNVHDDVLQFLSQKPYLNWKYRGGAMAPQPNFAPAAKPMVLTINERSLSDAEMTAEGFRQLGLGQIIGVETYRWIIFTSGKSFVDGSFCRLPSWGCFTLEGENLETTGVAPDIEVRESFHDRLHNRRPQLDKAIEELLKQL